jgi:DNA-binding beta-propeller fold protein YncE
MPLGVAITPDGSRAYVSNALASVSVVDISTNTIVTTIPIIDTTTPFPFPARNLFAIALSPDGTRAYVVSESSGNTYVIATSINFMFDTVRTNETTSGSALSIAISPNSPRAYVATLAFSPLILIIDTNTNTIIKTINAPGMPPFVGVTPDGTRLYVNAREGDGPGEASVTIVDASTFAIISKIVTSDPEWGIAFGTLPPVPKTKDDCKSSGYQRFTVLDFPNQGQCLKYVKEHAN